MTVKNGPLFTQSHLAGAPVTALLEDQRGRMWFGLWGGGVMVYDGKVFQHIDKKDGLANHLVQHMLQTREGDIWIATEGGVTRFRAAAETPDIQIENVISDRSHGAVSQVELFSNQSHLMFEFTGTGLKTRSDQFVYQYRLVGYDDGWLFSRENRVTYVDLAVGEYSFEVKAVDLTLNYSAEPARVRVAVLPQKFSIPIGLEEVQVGDVFASFYQNHNQQPLGSAKVVNNGDHQAKVKLRFELPGLIHSPFEQTLVLAPQSKQVVELRPHLDIDLLQIQNDRLVQAEIELLFEFGGQELVVGQRRDVAIYKPGALRWDIVGRAAAFITPTDSLVTAFARQSLVAYETQIRAYGRPLANLTRALVLFEALKKHGIRYLVDANSPYAKASTKRTGIDHIQYPPELLQSKSGDCDDLTVLYASLLENAGVPTALVDYPGHIFLLFDTGISRRMAFTLPLAPQDYVERNDQIWLPVETTALDQPFATAWQQGLELYKQLPEPDRRRRIVDTAKAWGQYPPGNLFFARAIELPRPGSYRETLLAQFDELEDQVEQYIDNRYIDPLKADPHNSVLRAKLGRLYVALEQYDTAIEAAIKYLRSPGGRRASTYNHLGLVHYYKGKLQQAGLFLEQALELAPEDGRIQANLAIVREALGEIEAEAAPSVDEVPATQGTKGEAGWEVGEFHWVE